MHLTKPLSFLAKQMTKTAIRSTALATLGLILLAGGVLTAQNLLVAPQTAQAATPPDSCFAFNAGTGTITDYYDHEGNNSANPACPRAVDIPATIGGVPVTKIGTSAFYRNQLTSVTIPSSVTSIGNSAFSVNQLTSVTIPSSVTSIGYYAFNGNQLTSVTIPSSVTSIGGGAFRDNQLTTVTFQGSVTTFGADIFLNNPLTSITYDGTTYTDTIPLVEQCYAFSSGTITDYKQYDMNLIKNSGIACMKRDVVIPSTIGGLAVTSIGNSAFRSKQLTSVTIPSSVTSIGGSAFLGNQLTSVTIPSSVTSIGDYAFQANQLTSVTIGCGISTLGREVFAINKLTDVNIPNCITSIDPTTFFGQNPWGGVVDTGSDPDHYWYSDDPVVRQLVFDNIWYARLYTADPTNPNGLKDGITDEAWHTGDINNDGDAQDSIGGHLINPGSTTTSYHSATGSELAPDRIVTGRLSSGTDLTDYLVKNVQTPVFANSQTPTPAEQAALDQALSVYYRAGSTQTFTPPAIPGYVTPVSQTKTLTAGDNTVNFTYNQQVLSVPFTNNDVTDGVLVPNNTPATVASPLIAESNLSIANDGACSTIQSAGLLAPNAVTAPSNVTILGGLGFTLDCTNGATTAVTFTLGSQADLGKLRVYKDTVGTLTDITSQVTLTSVNGKTVITYTLTDGGDLDEDGLANGTIVDPVFIGTTPDGELADTGMSMVIVFGVGAVLVLSGVAGMTGRLKKRA